jgi:cardiolipin synthase
VGLSPGRIDVHHVHLLKPEAERQTFCWRCRHRSPLAFPPGSAMTIPNIITIARLICVPVIIYAMLLGALDVAFLLFLAAGISDGVDGFIARRYNQRSKLGAYIDPVADKLLLVSTFIMLGFIEALPLWLIITVVSRDVLIIAAVVLSSLTHNPVEMKPIFVSKANTAMQVVLLVVVLAQLSLGVAFGPLVDILILVVALLTVLSGAAYLRTWLAHMAKASDDA